MAYIFNLRDYVAPRRPCGLLTASEVRLNLFNNALHIVLLLSQRDEKCNNENVDIPSNVNIQKL